MKINKSIWKTDRRYKTELHILYSVFFVLVLTGAGRCERIKDIVDIQGIRGNPLTGIGLVIGLADTGDSTLPSRQMLTNILRDAGIILSPSNLTGGNIAVVIVTTELGPFDREGSHLDVDVSAIGDAKSLQGGMLLPTPLEGLDGQVYAVAQGSISTGSWTVAGEQAAITKNHPTIGRIPNGAIVEKQEIATYIEYVGNQRFITLGLRNSDFSTAEQISKTINQIHPNIAMAIDAGTVKIRIPDNINHADITGFIDNITKPQVTVDVPAVVVVNERTGTIVVGENVGISAVAISQGSLVVKVKETATVSQPTAPFSDAGTTQVIPESIVDVEEKNAYLIPVSRSITIAELAKALNAIGTTPRDMIAIFNALKKAGALQAKLVIM
ncbi:MAG: hypothetical protein A2173_07195 [Planctomycetes bacterium RBG_13_44_8b]|nr:MAG: hypothetical protein A2173_07195 [Planctomycetes bacterium RBG_13_44_8b]